VDGVGVVAQCREVGEEGVVEVVNREADHTSSVGVPVDRWVGFSAQEMSVGEFSVAGEGVEGFRGACSDGFVSW
jgi:hypothetical protein